MAVIQNKKVLSRRALLKSALTASAALAVASIPAVVSQSHAATPKPSAEDIKELERVIRGLERCGYSLYAVVTQGKLNGYVELFPDRNWPVTQRTVEKWQKSWWAVRNKLTNRVIAEHLLATGRDSQFGLKRLSRTRFYKPNWEMDPETLRNGRGEA